MTTQNNHIATIRRSFAQFKLSPRVEPNEEISLDRAFFPAGHRGVLDSRRQLVIGNRGVGKSFWTHALLNKDVRVRLSEAYGQPSLKQTEVIIGFNGSTKKLQFAPTTEAIQALQSAGTDPGLLWRAVVLRIVKSLTTLQQDLPTLPQLVAMLDKDPQLYSTTLTEVDDALANENRHLLLVFDALDRLGHDWARIRVLTRALLRLVLGLQSFRSIRAKIFMRVDQFSDTELFKFPDSSKIRNDHVSLTWQSSELYSLLFFEVMRSCVDGASALREVAISVNAESALPVDGRDSRDHVGPQQRLVNALAGEYMGSSKKRGLVYTWVPLHLSDAASTCSPRSFLTAWQRAAEHFPAPTNYAVDHAGLIEGVRSASTSRLNELYEDYEWIRPSLEALRRQFVPMPRAQLFEIWRDKKVIEQIRASRTDQVAHMPALLGNSEEPADLLEAMVSVAVMEERANGKINVPDIFRVEAEILRRGGVAVPRRA